MIATLVIDDHAVVRQGLRQILTSIPDVVVTGEAGTAREGLKMALKNHYEMVLLDIHMPDGSGLDVLKQLKTVKSEVHVLILSMYPEEQYAIRALRAGASGYLTKASAPEELVLAIKKISSGGKYVSSSLTEALASSLQQNYDIPLHQTLSDREYQVMCMIASGNTPSKIASTLNLSVKTISSYRYRILQKMRMQNNTELSRYALENQLL